MAQSGHHNRVGPCPLLGVKRTLIGWRFCHAEQQWRHRPGEGRAAANHTLSPGARGVDTFRFLHRMPSRAAAVRELLRHGIANVGAVLENAGVASGDYGVLKAPKGLGPERKSKS